MSALIVDDDLSMRTMLGMILEDKGFQVSLASNGLEALKRLDELNITVLITDFNMPYMTGGELVREIIAKGIRIEKIIVISGLADNEHAIGDLLLEHSNMKFLQKPFSIPKFISAIKEA